MSLAFVVFFVGIAALLAGAGCANSDAVDSIASGGASGAPDGSAGKDGGSGAVASGGKDAGSDAAPVCGDGVREGSELCDGSDLGGKTCLTLAQGFVSGDLACSSDCKFDTGACKSGCGDGVIQPGEECDGINLAGRQCGTLGFSGGTLACTADCQLDPSACYECGDGVIQEGEACDGAALGGATCASLGHVGGTLGCQSNCLELDESGCTNPPSCGNGLIDSGEACDGANLNGKTCASIGYTGGALSCSAGCSLDTSSCYTCGNGTVEGPEACDTGNFGGKTCVSQGFTAGNLACTSACLLDTSGCTQCGDGVITSPEVCDGSNLGGKTCKLLGHGSGPLSCTSNCLSFDQGECSDCGNNVIDSGEQCDDGGTTPGDGCDQNCQLEACDPDGVYNLTSAPISYACCLGLVSVNVSSFIFSSNGASIQSSPSNPATLIGAATTCPSGSFTNQASIAGGCTEGYKLTGSFTSKDTWTGTYTLTFTGSQCGCSGLGTPCVNQAFSVTAKR